MRRSFATFYGPLYQAAYLLGGLQLRALHREVVETGKMTDREFHDAILKENALPIDMVRALVTGRKLTANYKPDWKFYGPIAVKTEPPAANPAQSPQQNSADAAKTGRVGASQKAARVRKAGRELRRKARRSQAARVLRPEDLKADHAQAPPRTKVVAGGAAKRPRQRRRSQRSFATARGSRCTISRRSAVWAVLAAAGATAFKLARCGLEAHSSPSLQVRGSGDRVGALTPIGSSIVRISIAPLDAGRSGGDSLRRVARARRIGVSRLHASRRLPLPEPSIAGGNRVVVSADPLTVRIEAADGRLVQQLRFEAHTGSFTFSARRWACSRSGRGRARNSIAAARPIGCETAREDIGSGPTAAACPCLG